MHATTDITRIYPEPYSSITPPFYHRGFIPTTKTGLSYKPNN
jgi:hypothetical protein